MDIISSHSQVLVKDNKGSSGVNINSLIHGYVADLYFWGSSAYLARRKDSGIHILIAPNDEWEEEIKEEGFVIIGKLSDIFKKLEQS